MQKSKKSTVILSAIMIILSVCLILGVTLAYFTDTRRSESAVNFGKIEISVDEPFSEEVTLKDVLPGDKLTDAIKFSKAVDSEPMYIRAKVSFESDDASLSSLIDELNTSAIETVDGTDYVWSGKKGKFYYLVEAGDTSRAFAVCDTSEITLTNAIELPRSLNQMADYGQYFKEITLKVELQAIQVASVNNNIIEIDSVFEELFGEAYYTFDNLYEVTGNTITGLSEEAKTFSELTIPTSYERDGETIDITRIGASVFQDNENIVSLSIPEGITGIGEYAFNGATNLTNITLPTGITSIGRDAFVDTAWYNSQADGLVYASDWCIGYKGTVPTTLTFSDTCVGIADYAFYNCTELTGTLTLPANIVYIGQHAFDGCTNLTVVDFEGNPVSTPSGAYAGVNNAQGESTMALTSIGTSAFYNCTSLNAVHITDLKAWVSINFSNAQANPLYEAGNLYLNGEALVDYTMPSDITKIRAYSFYNCQNITGTLTLSEGVNIIGLNAFSNCSNMLTLSLPESLWIVGYNALSGCSKLVQVENKPNLSLSGLPNNAGQSVATDASEFTNSISTVNDKYIILTDTTGTTTNKYLVGLVDTSITDATDIPNDVSYIYPDAFSASSNLDLVLPSGITTISDKAFNGIDLKSVVIPDTVTTIGANAFQNCTNLTSITIGDGVTDIGVSAFANCTNLTSVTIGQGVKSIGNSAFSGCTGLTEINYNAINCEDLSASPFSNVGQNTEGITVNIGASVQRIPACLFYSGNTNNAPNIKSVTIGESVASIGGQVFWGCTALTEINYNAINCADLSSGSRVFFQSGQATDGLTVTIGPNVQRIPAYLFYESGSNFAPKITSVVFEEVSHCESIGNYAFRSCSGLARVVLPSNVHYSTYSFSDSTVIVNISDLETEYNNAYYRGVGDNPYHTLVISKDTSITSCQIHPDTVVIAEEAFYNCRNLESVVFEGNKCTTIGDYAFYYCSNLNIELPSSLTIIGENAFRYCNSITSIKIPENVSSIGEYAFYNCEGLTSIEIPENVTSIGRSAFLACYALTEIKYNAINCSDLASDSAIFQSSGRDTNGITVTIGASVQSIPAYIFNGVSKITSVVFEGESQCISIGNYAFNGCSALTSISIPDKVMSIGENAFGSCFGLTSITIPESVTSIGRNAFYDCTGLIEINYNATNCDDPIDSIFIYAGKNNSDVTLTIGANVQKIPAYSFYNSRITKVVFEDGSQCTSIGNYAFRNCSNLTSISFPNSLTTIGDYAFADCSNLNGITIPSTITDLGAGAFDGLTYTTEYDNAYYLGVGDNQYYMLLKAKSTSIESCEINLQTVVINASAFEGCTSLKNISIPENVKRIGARAFYGCSGLIDITMPESLTSIGEWAFYNCSSLTSITIPTRVANMGNYAFYNCTKLTTINYNAVGCNDLANNNNAFRYAGNYASGITVNIGANVQRIPAYLFNPYNSSSYAPKITNVKFAEGSQCEEIGDYAFYYCRNLTSVTLPVDTIYSSTSFSSSTSVEGGFIQSDADAIEYDNAYYLGVNGNPYHTLVKAVSTDITTCTIHEDTVVISANAFENCSSLTSITIPENVANIGNYAFRGCTGLTEINYNATNCEDLTSNSFVFNNAGSTENGLGVTIGANVEKIPAYLFRGISKMTGVLFAEESQCASIGLRAFYGCTGLTSITIPKSVTNIGGQAFYNATALTEINYNATNCADLSSNAGAFYNAGNIGGGIQLNIGKGVQRIPASLFGVQHYDSNFAPKITSVTFEGESQCASIGNYAFQYCDSLTDIVIPDSVTSIGNSAFSYCIDLQSVTIGQGVTNIDHNAFSNCTKLTEIHYNATYYNDILSNNYIFMRTGSTENGLTVTIGKNVQRIPSYLFYSSNISSVVFAEGSQCTSIGISVFGNCSRLTEVYISSISEWLQMQFEGSTSNPLGYANKLYVNNQLTTEITIPENVTSIGNYAFYSFTSLQSIAIGQGVTSIGSYAFYNCNNLSTITIPDSVTSIGSYALSSCTGLQSVTIGQGVTNIENNAFYGCTSLSEINYNATNCEDLSSDNQVFYNVGQSTDGVTVNIGANVHRIPAYLFNPSDNSSYSPYVSSVIFDNGSQCISIGDYAFAYSSSLYEINLPDSLVSLGHYAFYNCYVLTDITIPVNVKAIGYCTFSNCINLMSVTVSSTLKYIDFNAFYGCDGLSEVVYNGTDAEWQELINNTESGNEDFIEHNGTINLYDMQVNAYSVDGSTKTAFDNNFEVIKADGTVVTDNIQVYAGERIGVKLFTEVINGKYYQVSSIKLKLSDGSTQTINANIINAIYDESEMFYFFVPVTVSGAVSLELEYTPFQILNIDLTSSQASFLTYIYKTGGGTMFETIRLNQENLFKLWNGEYRVTLPDFIGTIKYEDGSTAGTFTTTCDGTQIMIYVEGEDNPNVIII